MNKTGKYLTQDNLVEWVRRAVQRKLEVSKKGKDKEDIVERVLDSVMSGLAMFSFKFPSLLQFDHLRKSEDRRYDNLCKLFGIKKVPCDTYMREVLDEESPSILRTSFTRIFALLQRGGVLKNFLFMDKYYIISLDGTGYF